MKVARKWILVTLVWCLLIEGGAWIADAIWGFRYTLLDRLETAERSSTPVAEADPEWEPGTLRVRVPDRGEARSEPYAIGGRVIADAWPDAKQDPIRPEDLEGETRPRVFILGGSAALGYPYAYEDSMAVRLARLRPDLRIINAGQVGWTSGQVLGVARRITSEYRPAVLVVYAGNNEWIQWAPTVGGDPSWQRPLSHSRALAAAFYLGHQSAPPPDDSPPLIGWRHAFAHPDRRLDVPQWRRQREAYVARFRQHLSTIDELAHEAGGRAIFLTVPFQYKLSPSFRHPQPDAFDPSTAEEHRRLVAEATELMEHCERAEPLLARAIELDAGPALPHYLRGVCAERAGRHEEAESHYASSRDAMVGNLGGRLVINETIRELAAERSVELVDIANRFDEISHAAGEYYNASLIHDDCHPTPAGQRHIAAALAERL